MQRVDERRYIKILETEEQAIEYAAFHFIEKTSKAEKPVRIALSGGSTPKKVYTLLSSKPLPWNQYSFYWGDERLVPLDHKDSNYRMAKETALLDHGSILYPMWQEGKSNQELAEHYEKLLEEPLFYAMGGVGNDGHTLSLFPPYKSCPGKTVLTLCKDQNAHPHPRLSMTMDYFNTSSHLVVYIMGSSKAEILAKILQNNPQLPAFHLGTTQRPALFIVDRAAASIYTNKGSI